MRIHGVTLALAVFLERCQQSQQAPGFACSWALLGSCTTGYDIAGPNPNGFQTCGESSGWLHAVNGNLSQCCPVVWCERHRVCVITGLNNVTMDMRIEIGNFCGVSFCCGCTTVNSPSKGAHVQPHFVTNTVIYGLKHHRSMVSSPGDDPTHACRLLQGVPAILAQIVLGALALTGLVYKRYIQHRDDDALLVFFLLSLSVWS